jgi:hypothetical protein
MMNWNDLEENGRGLIWRYYPGIRLENWEKPRITSVSIAGIQAAIWTSDLPDTKQGC